MVKSLFAFKIIIQYKYIEMNKNNEFRNELIALKRKYGYNKPRTPPRNIFNTPNIDFNEGYINKDNEYFLKYSNNTIKQIINQIYKQKEIQLNDNYEIINDDEYKFIMNSLITDDFFKLNATPSIRIKLYNHLHKQNIFNIHNLGCLFNLLKSVFNKDEILKDCCILVIKHNLTHFENTQNIEKWQIKYLIYLFKIMAVFDVPFLESQPIIHHRMNKYNFIQHKFIVGGDFGDFGTFEKMEDGAIYYFNHYIYPLEDKEINGKTFYNISKEFLKLNNFLCSKNKQENKNIIEILIK